MNRNYSLKYLVFSARSGARRRRFNAHAGLVATVLIPLALLTSATPLCADDLFEQRQTLNAEFSGQLDELTAWCESVGLDTEAGRTRSWVLPRDPNKIYLVDVTASDAFELSDDAGEKTHEWQRRFEELRNERADALFDLARSAIRQQRASLAFELVLDAVRENPDHEAARRLLGYQLFHDEWRTPYEIRKLRNGFVWHDRFGWLLEDHVERYEAGERWVSGRWITAEEDAQRRSRIERGWQVETDHYVVQTNHSLEAGVQLSQRLERFYRAWQQVFARFYVSESQLESLFEGRAAPRRKGRRHRVVYFRNRDEYFDALRGSVRGDFSRSTGIYLGDHRTAYFFADENDERPEDYTTLYHEATHQLFSESRPIVRSPGGAANFWIVEGIACYMESFTEHDGYSTLGGFDAVRFGDARYRLVEDGFYVPLVQLTALGMDQLQQDERIAMLYSQSAGLTQFLMHADEGRYRDGLTAYLVAVYTGRDRPTTLAEIARQPFASLDKKYKEYVTATGK